MSEKHAKSILVVEDDEAIRLLLQELLESEGYSVQTAIHGRDALDLLQSSKKPPNLILLDYMMPVMDGKTFLAEFPIACPELKGTPICVLTAAGRTELLALNPNVSLLRKPLDIDDLIEMVESLSSNSI
jgi:CheY-like chemotaxis protein